MAQPETPAARSEMPTLALGLLAFCVGVIFLMVAFVLGAHLQSSPSADANTIKAQVIAVPAGVALVTGVVSLAARRRDWAVTVGWVGAGAAVVAVLLNVLFPGG